VFFVVVFCVVFWGGFFFFWVVFVFCLGFFFAWDLQALRCQMFSIGQGERKRLDSRRHCIIAGVTGEERVSCFRMINLGVRFVGPSKDKLFGNLYQEKSLSAKQTPLKRKKESKKKTAGNGSKTAGPEGL